MSNDILIKFEETLNVRLKWIKLKDITDNLREKKFFEAF